MAPPIRVHSTRADDTEYNLFNTDRRLMAINIAGEIALASCRRRSPCSTSAAECSVRVLRINRSCAPPSMLRFAPICRYTP